MQAYSELVVASAENLSSDPSLLPAGRFWLNTTENDFKMRINSVTTVMMRRDKAIVGTNGTLANNIRLHRGAAALLQVVPGNDATADGTLATSLGQLDARVINFANVASLPAAGQVGRTAYAIAEAALYYDNGSAWVALAGFGTQTANTIFAGPTSGAAANPTFRAMDYRDFPGRVNLAVNADARIVERGVFTSATAFSALADTIKFYAVDYFGGVVVGLTSAQVTVQTLSGDLPSFANHGNSIKIAATATNASARMGSYQVFEDPTSLRGKFLSLQWWVKSNNTNARISIFDSVGIVGVSSPHTGGGGWELLTASGTISTGATSVQINSRIMTAANGNVNITNGDFIQHYFPVFYEGTVFPGYILAGGGTDTAERALCEYQFQKWTGGGIYFADIAYQAGSIDFIVLTRRPMRAAPALRFIGTAGTDFAVINKNGGGTQAGFTFASSTSTVDGVTFTATKAAHGLTQPEFRLIGSTGIIHLDAGA